MQAVGLRKAFLALVLIKDLRLRVFAVKLTGSQALILKFAQLSADVHYFVRSYVLSHRSRAPADT